MEKKAKAEAKRVRRNERKLAGGFSNLPGAESDPMDDETTDGEATDGETTDAASQDESTDSNNAS